MITDMILCWEWMDASLEKTLQIMNQVPNDLYGAIDFGRAVAAIIALLVGAGEAYMMMLGKKGMDAMKILRIAIIAIAISVSPSLAAGIRAPFVGTGDKLGGMEGAFKEMLKEQDEEIDKLGKQVAELRGKLVYKIDSARVEIEKTKITSYLGHNWFSEGLAATIATAKNTVDKVLGGAISEMIYWQTTMVGTAFKKIVEWIAETVFQMVYYGVLVGQRAFLAVMAIFLPFVLALSLAPPYRNAWSQWLSKYISVCLWGTVVFICMRYINTLMIMSLQADLKEMNDIIAKATVNADSVSKAVSMVDAVWNNIKGALYTVVVYLIGGFVIRQVPEVCSWLVPGGVSSHWGHTVGGASQALTMYAGAKAMQAGSFAVGAVSDHLSHGSSSGGGTSAASVMKPDTGIGGDQSGQLGSRGAEPPTFDGFPQEPPSPPSNS